MRMRARQGMTVFAAVGLWLFAYAAFTGRLSLDEGPIELEADAPVQRPARMKPYKAASYFTVETVRNLKADKVARARRTPRAAKRAARASVSHPQIAGPGVVAFPGCSGDLSIHLS